MLPSCGTQQGVEFPDCPVLERPILPDFNKRLQVFCNILFWPVITHVKRVPFFLQVLNVVDHGLGIPSQAFLFEGPIDQLVPYMPVVGLLLLFKLFIQNFTYIYSIIKILVFSEEA